MKKVFFWLLLIPVLTGAQTLKPDTFESTITFQKQFQVIQAGIGFPNLQTLSFKKQSRLAGAKYNISGVGPYFLKYEYAVFENLGIGLILAYYASSQEDVYSYKMGIRDPITGYVRYYDY